MALEILFFSVSGPLKDSSLNLVSTKKVTTIASVPKQHSVFPSFSLWQTCIRHYLSSNDMDHIREFHSIPQVS